MTASLPPSAFDERLEAAIARANQRVAQAATPSVAIARRGDRDGPDSDRFPARFPVPTPARRRVGGLPLPRKRAAA